ncbi:MAG: hypothetical protein EPO39_04075 [Candidatus Manganitrophaceae bacterium]|nr:MAG: hypothetical protein EPO39_04075 [Candidatus Manganitrophaceae bacterium]
MRRASEKWILIAWITSLCLAVSGIACAQEVVAVLSAELGPYREALEGLQEALGHSVTPIPITEGTPRISLETRVVVAFGGKAAQWSYPDRIVLIYGMAPGTTLGLRDRKGFSIEVNILPRAETLLEKLKELQPNLKRLAVLWSSKSVEDYLSEIRKASESIGLEILSERLNSPGDLPDRLRALFGKVDALWLLPDPPLVNSQTVSTLKEYSWSNDIPFYAPTAGFVQQGATASISSSFREIGRAAGMAARKVLEGELAQGTVYPEKTEVTVSIPSAESAGLHIPPEALRKADKVLP